MVAINDRSYDQSWPPTIDRTINRGILREQLIGGKVARPVARLIVRPLTIWNSRFQVLNMTIDLVATDLPLGDHPRPLRPVVRPLRPVVRSFFDLPTIITFFSRSQVGRNLVVSPMCVGFEHDHDLAATDLPIAITHDLCDQSYDLCDQSYILSTIGPFFGRR